ncbi:MAG TPA: ATP-binding protein [Pirellulales bacterium]|nr:ATP-binding protein [Pirellulales bacterium]
MAFRLSDRQLAGLLAVAGASVFGIDVLLPLGIGSGVFYVPLVAAAALFCSSANAVYLTLFFLVLMGVEVFLSAQASSLDAWRLAVINRGVSMLMIAALAGVMIPLRRIRAALSASRERYQVLQAESAEEVQRLNAELEERVRQRTAQVEAINEELEAFTYSVSHDLRAPLRGMSGFARVLEEDYGERLDDDGRRYLEIIKSNAAHMGRLIDDLLSLSRLGRQPLKATTISLDELAKEAFREASADDKQRNIELTIDTLPECRGDASLLRQVLINLLSNAVKFTRHASPARIYVGSTSQNGEVVYFVRDNGAGFDMRYAGKLFGVFQRLHGIEEFAGTGVGLAIVKRIVERHGGRIWAEGEPGKGATFYFTLAREGRNVE